MTRLEFFFNANEVIELINYSLSSKEFVATEKQNRNLDGSIKTEAELKKVLEPGLILDKNYLRSNGKPSLKKWQIDSCLKERITPACIEVKNILLDDSNIKLWSESILIYEKAIAMDPVMFTSIYGNYCTKASDRAYLTFKEYESFVRLAMDEFVAHSKKLTPNSEFQNDICESTRMFILKKKKSVPLLFDKFRIESILEQISISDAKTFMFWIDNTEPDQFGFDYVNIATVDF